MKNMIKGASIIGTIPIYMTDGFNINRTEQSMPNLVELNWAEAMRNNNRAVIAVDIELTIVPARPV